MNAKPPSLTIYDSPVCFRYAEKCTGELAYNQYDHPEATVLGEWSCKKNADGIYGAIV